MDFLIPIVFQCGADSLFGDTCDLQNPFNLTVYGYGLCIKELISKFNNLPIIFLGGGIFRSSLNLYYIYFVHI